MKYAILVLLSLLWSPLASVAASCSTAECAPDWFKQNREHDRALGCLQDYREYYWAKRLPAQSLSIGCAADGDLIVAPPGASLDFRAGKHVTTIWQSGKWSSTGKAFLGFPRDVVPYDFLYFIGELDGTVNFRVYFRNEHIRPVFDVPGTDLKGIDILGIGEICAWPKEFSKDEIIKRRGPFFCGPIADQKFVTESILFGIDGYSRVHIRIHKGIVSEAAARKLYQHVSAYVHAFKQIKQTTQNEKPHPRKDAVE